MKELLRKIAKTIILQPKNKVCVEISHIEYNHALEGQNIVITGGSKGIGLAMAQKFVSEGANVLITGRNEATLKKALSTIGKMNNVSYLVHDMESECDFGSLIRKFQEKIGEITSLVLNAGISLHEGNILNVTPENYDRQFNINLRANYFLAQAFLKYKIDKNEKGNILFLSSETAAKCVDIPYGLTKAALNSLVGALARRVYLRGIRVNAIAPGVTYTDMTKGSHKFSGDYSNNSTSGRFFLAEEIAEVASFVLSKASVCITGEVLYCDAGSHLMVNGDTYSYSI